MKMRNIFSAIALCGLLLGLCATSASAFIFPVTPPVGLPASGSGMACRPLHLGADSYTKINFYGQQSNVYAHSWSSSGMNGPCTQGQTVTGIAWRRTDPNNTVTLQQGSMALDHDFMDLEVAIVQDGSSNIYIVASYYKNLVGHFYRIYRWTPGGVFLLSTTQLSAQTGYSRISIDGCSMRLLTIAWDQIGVGIRALAAFGTGVGLNVGTPATISGSANQAFPDVEVWNMNGNFRTSFVYFLNNNGVGQGNITMSDIDFFTVHGGGAIAPSVLDVNPSAFPYWTPGTIHMWYAASYASLNLDRPDDHAISNWSYVYTDDFYNIKARMRSTGLLTTWTLNNGSIFPLANISTSSNYWPTIAFGNDGEEIYYGWYSEFPGAQYVAIKLKVNGTPLVNDYMIISNTTNVAITASMQFSKQNEDSRLFNVYSMFNPGLDYFINCKYIPWSAAAFKSTSIADANVSEEISLFPNPFRNELNINLPASMQSQWLTINITDITGRTVDFYSGTGSSINAHVKDVSSRLNTGTYLVKVYEQSSGFNNTYKVQKTE